MDMCRVSKNSEYYGNEAVLQSLMFISPQMFLETSNTVTRKSERLRYSWCESKRVSVRTWYAFLSTYIRMNFYEVPFNFDTAHNKRGKPSKPVIPPAPVLQVNTVLKYKTGAGRTSVYLNLNLCSRSTSRCTSCACIL